MEEPKLKQRSLGRAMTRLRNTSGKAGAIGVLCGVAAGLIAGIWLRVLMRLVALTAAPGPVEIQDPEGNLVSSSIPVFTIEGSLSVIFFPAVIGFFLGFGLFILRAAWPATSRYRGTLFGVLLLVVPGISLLLNTPELSIGPNGFGTALFALTPFVYAWAFEGLLRSGERVVGGT